MAVAISLGLHVFETAIWLGHISGEHLFRYHQITKGTRGPSLNIQPTCSQRLCWYAAESPDDPGRRRLRSGSKVNADAGSPVVAEEPVVRRSKRQSRQTLESSDDEGGTDGQPAAKRHLDLQATGKVCSVCRFTLVLMS